MTRLAPGHRPRPDSASSGALPTSLTAALPEPLPRREPVERLPILILFPHSRCNCRCLMCDIWKATGREEIGLEEAEGWLDEWRRLGVRRIVLSGGEPLLHSRARDLCERLAAEGFALTLLSTGLLMGRAAPWLVRFVDDVVVSLDGPREVHDRVRNLPGAFDKLASGVAEAHAAARDAGRDLDVSARCTVQRANFRHLRATARAAREIGVSRLSFLAVDVSSEAFERPGGWSEEKARLIAPGPEDLPDLEREIDTLEREHGEDFATGFLAESPAKLRRKLHEHFRALAGLGDFPTVSCNAPWVSTVIEADGTVRPCFFQPPLGNLRRDGGLGEILNSPRARDWRRGLDTRRDEICRRCVCSLQLREEAPPRRQGERP